MKRVLVICCIVALVLALSLAGGCTSKTEEKVEAAQSAATAAEKVDDKLSEIWDDLGTLDESYNRDKDDLGLLPATYLSAIDDIGALQEKVAEARELAGDVPSKPIKDKYLETCDALDTVLADALAKAQTNQPLAQASKIYEEAFQYEDTGASLLNEAVVACNGKNYTGGEQKANEARTQYQAMLDSFSQAASLSGMAQVSSAVQYIQSQVLVCQYQAELAQIGKRGGVNSYNAQIDKLNAQEAQSSSLYHFCIEAEDAFSAALDDGLGDVESHADSAEDLWEEARDLVRAEKDAATEEK